MHRQLVALATITVTVLTASQAAASEGPYSDGRLTHVAYVELAAKADVIAETKNYAASQGWVVDCEQPAGNLLTIRLRFPAGTRQTAIESYFGDIRDTRRFKAAMVYHGMRTSAPLCATLP